MKSCWLRLASFTLTSILLSIPSAALSQVTEVEPNDTCAGAQNIGLLPGLPTTVFGHLEVAADIDFYRFETEPGMQLRSELRGSASGAGTLGDPFLGLFDASCQLLDLNDDSELGIESQLDFEVPGDGIFILAATGCCDHEFNGGHVQDGSYELRLLEPPPAIGSISGRLVDAVTGMPLPGDQPPYSYAELRRCDAYGCYNWMNNSPADSDGHFYFDTNYAGQYLPVGEYVIAAWADQYEPVETERFFVPENEHYDLGDIGLQPPPLVFSNIVPCEVPVTGGKCSYSVDINNNTTDGLQGFAWSNVEVWGTGSPLGYTRFPAKRDQNVRVPALASRTVTFSFDVLPGVPDGAMFCAEGWFSYREMSYYGTLRNEFLFCVTKQYGALRTLDAKVAKGLLKERRDLFNLGNGPRR